jgi:hypothetical protein
MCAYALTEVDSMSFHDLSALEFCHGPHSAGTIAEEYHHTLSSVEASAHRLLTCQRPSRMVGTAVDMVVKLTAYPSDVESL